MVRRGGGEGRGRGRGTYFVEIIDGGAGREVEDELSRGVVREFVREDLDRLDKLFVGFADDEPIL